MLKRNPVLCVTTLLLGLLGSSLFADPVVPGVYQLLNHEDGALTASHGPYGLRYDAIEGPHGEAGAGPTFSFEGSGALVTLSWDGGASAFIDGTMINNFTGDIWNLHYEITGIVAVAGPNGGFTATGGSGMISLASDGTVSFDLEAETNGDGHAFLFLGDGHRVPGTTDEVGRGWLQPPGSTDDFLFRAAPIPEPATLLLLGSGLLAGAGTIKKKFRA